MAMRKEAQFQQDIITVMVTQGWLTCPASDYGLRTLRETKEASL